MNNEELDIFYKVRKNFAIEDAVRAIEEYADDTVADQIDPAEVADEFLEITTVILLITISIRKLSSA